MKGISRLTELGMNGGVLCKGYERSWGMNGGIGDQG